MHRYGGDLSFLSDWTWDETVAFLPKALQFAADDQLRLRWYIRYETDYPHYEDFKAAVAPQRPATKREIETIVSDSLKMINLDWRAKNG